MIKQKPGEAETLLDTRKFVHPAQIHAVCQEIARSGGGWVVVIEEEDFLETLFYNYSKEKSEI